MPRSDEKSGFALPIVAHHQGEDANDGLTYCVEVVHGFDQIIQSAAHECLVDQLCAHHKLVIDVKED